MLNIAVIWYTSGTKESLIESLTEPYLLININQSINQSKCKMLMWLWFHVSLPTVIVFETEK